MKALAVFSGGLDSMLAAHIIRAQGIEVQGLFFETPFFPSAKARKSAGAIHLPLKVVDITEIHLEIVKNPKYGHGANMNPCIDCHALMLSEAGKRMEEEGAGFIITGEVLGQRPMSQNKHALSLVAAESGFGGFILRPLSAKLLTPTVPEQSGWVRREDLMDISGRSRKPQMALARNLGIPQYPSPAGGCLLTDAIFSRRFKDLLCFRPYPEIREIDLLKVGRHFRIGPHTKLVVGRNQGENERIRQLAGDNDLLLRAESIPGPTAIALGDTSAAMEEVMATITAVYSDAKNGDPTVIRLSRKDAERMLTVSPRSKSEFRGYMIE
jgi:tRNA-specific 2-thiouridylase